MEILIAGGSASRWSFSASAAAGIRRISHAGIFVCEISSIWIERTRQRRQLASLSDHMLSDIGINRADAWKECEKPFWRN